MQVAYKAAAISATAAAVNKAALRRDQLAKVFCCKAGGLCG